MYKMETCSYALCGVVTSASKIAYEDATFWSTSSNTALQYATVRQLIDN